MQPSTLLYDLKRNLRQKASTQKSKTLQRFFKTGMGEYGEGDIFIGVAVPEQRKTAKQFRDLPFGEIKKLLKSNGAMVVLNNVNDIVKLRELK